MEEETKRPDNFDPKGVAGALKAPLQLLPNAPLEEAAWVMKLGAEKYGAYNWAHNIVEAQTYIGAIRRHLAQWQDGEDIDEESGYSHLAHIVASAMILRDAMKRGNMHDNRPPRYEEDK